MTAFGTRNPTNFLTVLGILPATNTGNKILLEKETNYIDAVFGQTK
jgi:hypothetical protein